MLEMMIQPIEWEVECLFYGQRPQGYIPPWLSRIATKWACDNDMRTIWVSIRWSYLLYSCVSGLEAKDDALDAVAI